MTGFAARRRGRAIAVVALGLWTGPSWAQVAPQRLTLAEALARASQVSERLEELDAERSAAEALTEAREGEGRPLVSVQGSYLRTNHVDELAVPEPGERLRVIFPDLPNNYLARLDLRWPIYSGGRRAALSRVAQAELAASTADLSRARVDLRLEVTRAYWALVTARATTSVVEESLRQLEAHLRDVESRLRVGLAAPNEVLTVEAQRSRQRALVIEAHAIQEGAALELRRLLGLELDEPIAPIEPLDGIPGAEESLESMSIEARENRRDRRALSSRALAAREQVEAARAGSRPTVTIRGGVDYARPNNRFLPREDVWRDSWDVGISVTWPWLDGGRARAATRMAQARHDAWRARLRAFDGLLDVELRQRYLELEAAIAGAAASNDGVESAREARRVVGERFAAGVATSTEVLDAHVAVLRAELDRTRALAEVRVSQARLEHAIGR